MKLKKLILHGFHRFMLNNIKHFVYTPEADLQIILGTNGSGKSSLLGEISPFPASSSDFAKDGYKKAEFEDKGNLYTLMSTFKSGTRHSFDKNGLEMNPGGTGAVQKELIRQEFGITQDIHNLLVGATKFTDMPPTLRRQWITRLNSSDLTFATQTFNDVRTLHRDALGAFKHIQSRLSIEVNKISDYTDIENLERHVKQTQEELTLLMENRELGLPSHNEIARTLEEDLKRLEDISRQTLNLRLTKPSGITTEEAKYLPHVEAALAEVRQQLSITESIHAHYTTEYAELDTVVSTLGLSNAESVEDLEDRLHSLEEEESNYLEKITNNLIETNSEEIRNDTTAVIEQVVPILSNLPANPNRKYNPTQYVDLRNENENTLAEINRLYNRVAQLESRKEHILSTKDIACPKCTYVWKPDILPQEIGYLEDTITLTNNLIFIKNELYKEKKDLLDETEDYSTRLKSFFSVCNSYPRLSLLWQAISVDEVLYENPKDAIAIIQTWHSDVRHSHTLSLMRQESKVIRETLQHIRLLSQNDSSHISDRIKVLAEHIETHTAKITELRQEQAVLKAYRDMLVKVRENKAEIQRLVQKVNEEQVVLQRILRDQSLIELIGSHQTTLALSQTRLNEKQTIDGIINDLREDVDTVNLEKISYQLLMEELSPSSGLIAEYLMESIQAIISGINTVVGAVWTQPLVVQNCDATDGELDYKFPMSVGHQAHSVEDISEGSAGMLEIINFAFVIVAYVQLGLEDYPLFLDELGKTFDEQHRINVMAYIKGCVESKQFSQIFLVSHYASQHGSLANCETLVLDGTNISVPLINNKHVIME